MITSAKRIAPCMSGVFFALLLTLAACSGGGGASPSMPEQGQQPVQGSGQTPPPASVGVSSSVRIYVLNSNLRSDPISVYDEEGRPIANCPFANLLGGYGIAFDSHNSRLYVSTTEGPTGKLRVYDLDGNSITTSGSFPNPLPLITFDSNNRLIYTMNFYPSPILGVVSIFDEDGNPVTVSGSFPEAFIISGITFDPFNHRIYGTRGTLEAHPSIFAWDEQGHAVAVPNEPAAGYGCGSNVAITFDTHNRLFYVVTATGCGKPPVSAFDETGKPVPTTGTFPGIDFGSAITFDANNNRLYVLRNSPQSIAVYDEEGNPITTAGTFPRPAGAVGSGLVAAPQ